MKTLAEYVNEALLDKNLIKRQIDIETNILAWLPGDIVKSKQCYSGKSEYINKYYTVVKNDGKKGGHIYLQPVDDKNFNKTIGEVEEFKITSFPQLGYLKKTIEGKTDEFDFVFIQRAEKNKNPLRDIKTLKGGVKSALYLFEDYIWGGWFDIVTKNDQEYFDIDNSIRKSLKDIIDYTLENTSQMAKARPGFIGKSWDPKDNDSDKSKKMWDKFRFETGSDYPVLIVLKDKQIPGPYLFVNYNDNITSINKDIQNFIDLFDREYVDVWVQVEQ